MINLRVNKDPLMLGYMALNFALLEVDVVIAHSQNHFFRLEWIPLIYSPLAALSILCLLLFRKKQWAMWFFQGVMGLGVVVGFAGTLFHLAGNATSQRQPLYELLVTGSPVAAPIAFAGVAWYTLTIVRSAKELRQEKLVGLVGWGFVASLLAAYFDHARLHFLPVYTLFPIIAGTAGALACFWLAYFAKEPSLSELKVFLAMMALNLIVGLLGFVFHVQGDLAGTTTLNWARFFYRDPLLGPLLFCNLAVLGTLSLSFEKVAITRMPEETSLVS